MLRLSGPVRLWLVLAVPVWAYGAYQVATVPAPAFAYTRSEPEICQSLPPYPDADTPEGLAIVAECARQSADARRKEEPQLRPRRDSEHLQARMIQGAAWFAAPFSLMALWLIGAWVWRGFRPR